MREEQIDYLHKKYGTIDFTTTDDGVIGYIITSESDHSEDYRIDEKFIPLESKDQELVTSGLFNS